MRGFRGFGGMVIRCGALLALGLSLSPPARGQQQPTETLPGFRAENVLESRGIDNVNRFSGDPGVVIPIGPEYTLSAAYKWQLKAYYSAKLWKLSKTCTTAPEDQNQFADILGDPTLGVGWTMHPGYVETTFNGTGGSYVSPDGAHHTAGDGSHLRVTGISAQSPTSATVEFPDGSVQLFDHAYTPPGPAVGTSPDFTSGTIVEPVGPRYGLHTIKDRFGNLVLEVHYDTTRPWQVSSIVLTPNGTARTIAFHWAQTPYSPVAWWRVDRITFPPAGTATFNPTPVAGSTQLQVDFSIQHAVFNRNAFDNSGSPFNVQCPSKASPATVDAHVLNAITFSDAVTGSAFQPLAYGFSYNGSTAPADIQTQGTLQTIALPTAGSIRYDYGGLQDKICAFPTCDPEGGASGTNSPTGGGFVLPGYSEYTDSSVAVSRRTATNSDGKQSVTSYSHTLVYSNTFGCPNNCQLDEGRGIFRRVDVTEQGNDSTSITPIGPPLGSTTFSTRSFLVIPFQPVGGQIDEDGGIEVERRTFAGPDSTAPLLRTLVRCYGSSSPNPACGAWDTTGNLQSYGMLDLEPPAAEVVWFGAPPTGTNGGSCTASSLVPCVGTANSNYVRTLAGNTIGEFGTSVTTSNLPATGGWSQRSTSTTWTPVDTNTVSPPKRWMLDTFSSKGTTDTGGASPSTVSTGFTFNAAQTGFLVSTATSNSDGSTLTRSYTATGTPGDPTTASNSGTSPGFSGSTLDTRTFSSGLLLTSKRTNVSWNSFDVTRDPSTGAILLSRAPNPAVQTAYQYDAMGRLTKISPPSPDAATTIAYSSATQTNVTRPGGGDQIYLYDGFGRLAREIRQMRARYAVRVHVYDLAGHANFVSEWDACDWPGTCSTLVPAGTTSANFDALGRPGQVTRADASVTTYAYSDGAGSTVVTSSVSGSPAATTTIRDALGRVIHVTEPHVAGISDPNTTDYTYSVLDKLASVTQGAQGRTFTYDVNGMLRTEITPEKGTVQYTRYDATGGLLISSDARPVTLTRAYDSAGRLLTLSSSDGRTYVTNSYDGNFASYGQISSSSSLNHTFNQGDFTVTETYSYDPATSRLLSRATLLPGVATAFTTSWAYNSLGLVSTLTQQSGASVMGSLAYAYTNGFLTSINGTPAGLGATSVLTDATYTPAGGINTYSLGNSVTTTITPDGVMPRPRQISVSGGRWDSGVYTYDGVGNITAIGTDTYAYDAVSRLSSATILGTPYTFVYDRWGNLTKKGPTANPQTFVMDPGLTNRLQANGLVAYDAVGNLTNYGGGQVFRYDSLSRETDFSSSSPSVQESYVYDAAGERVARAATLPALLPILVTGDTEWSVCSDPTHTVSQQATLMAALGTAPYTWVITTPAGQYPSWITLSSAGAFSAIVPIAAPTATYTIAVKVTDASGRTGTATLKLMVSSACLHWLYEPQDEILCTGELFGAAALADAGGATISYQWQQGDANGNFTDIPGKTSATISIAPTAGVSFYRVRAFLATGAEIISQVATASFNVPIQQHLKLFGGNTVSFCLGAPAIDLSQFLYAIGGDLQMGWQQQLGDGTWQDVQGNNIAPTQTTTYRAKLVAFCPPQTVYSDSIVLLVSPPPSFTAAPPSQNFCAGSTVNLSASANVPSFFKWQRFDVPTITWITIQNGATQTSTSTLSVNPTATTAYRVIATNYCGVAESDFTLTQLTLPVVTGPTANITICPPLAYTLTTTVTNAVSQKWQLSADGFTWVDIPGATGTNYATPVFTTSGTYYYRIQATNTCGTVTNTSTITVLTQPPAYISGACSVSSGQSTTLTANTDFTATSFAWTPGGQSTQSITVSPTTTTTYTCAVRGSNGCPRFVSYTVNVGTRTDPPVITAGPPNVTICNGVAPTLSVTATGSNLLYQWQKPGMATGLWHLDENIGTIAGDSSGSGYTGGVTGTTIAPGRYSNSRVFATATDKITVSSAPNLATAGAISLEAWVRPTDLSNWNIVLVKQRAADPTSYAGNYELMIQPTTGSVWFSHLDSTGTARNYHSTGAVVVGIWSHIVATWQPGSPGQVQFYINGLPAGASADVSEGSAATTADPVTIGWRADGLHFTGQIDEVAVWKYARSANEIASAYGAAPDGWGGLPAATASTYTAPSSNASYRVQVSNACGVVNSGMATVTVSSNTPASIVTQPQSGFYCSGGSKTLTVVAAGTSPVYSWESYDPATSSWRYFSNTASVSVSPTIATQYRVTVSNSCNAVISNTVTVTPATLPTIVRQPVGGNACPPGLSLNVVAASDGDPDIHYQWRVNGTNIPGATAWTYLASSSGSYDVIVSNTCGSRTSTAAIANIQNCGFMATGPGAGTTSFYGVYDPATGNVTLDHGSADRLSARTIPVGRRGLVVVGDWDGDGVASLGFYDRRLGVFELWNGDPIGTGDYKFAFGPVGVDWQPVAGDWDGDGIDTVGLVNTATGDVLLRNTNSAGIADLSYRLRVGPKSGSAVAGDWTSKGYDTVGVYEPTSATFSLWDTHAGGGADHAIGVTANSKTSTPVAGDWSGNELASVGLFDPASGEIRVWYSLRPGTPDRTVVFAAGASASTQAFAGRWNGTKHAPGGRKTSRARPAGTQTAAMDSVETGPVPDLHAGPEPDLAQSSLAHHRGGSWVSRGFTLASNRTRVFGLVASRTSGTKSPQVAGLANGQTWFYTIRDQANRPSIQYHLDQSGNVIVDRFNAFFGDSLVASYESYQPTPEWTYYGSDHLGSARLVSGSAGNTLATPRYLPYGEAVSPPGANPEQFAGLERDVATAYDYDHARYATSTLGRFLAPDYLGGMTSIPQTWNRYSYARNNSLNAVDPNGLNATAYIIGTGMHEVNELGGHVMVAVSSDRGTGFLSKTTTLPDFHPGVPNAQVMEYLAEGRSVTEVTLRSTPAFDRALYDRISTHNYGAYDLLFNNCGESVCRSLITAGFPSQLLRVPLAPFLVENALVDSPFVLKVTHMYSYLDLGGMYNVRYDIVLFTNTQLTLDYHPAPTLARSIFDLLLTMQNIRIDGTTLAQ